MEKTALPQRLFSMQNTSDDSVNGGAPSNAASNKAESLIEVCKEDAGETDDRSSNSQAVKSHRRSNNFFKKKDKVPKRNNANNEAHGFISSFNQLTSNNLPVITTATTAMLKHTKANNKCERDNHAATIDDNSELSAAGQNAPIQCTSKANAKDDRSKYSEYSSFMFLTVSFCLIYIKWGKWDFVCCLHIEPANNFFQNIFLFQCSRTNASMLRANVSLSISESTSTLYFKYAAKSTHVR